MQSTNDFRDHDLAFLPEWSPIPHGSRAAHGTPSSKLASMFEATSTHKPTSYGLAAASTAPIGISSDAPPGRYCTGTSLTNACRGQQAHEPLTPSQRLDKTSSVHPWGAMQGFINKSEDARLLEPDHYAWDGDATHAYSEAGSLQTVRGMIAPRALGIYGQPFDLANTCQEPLMSGKQELMDDDQPLPSRVVAGLEEGIGQDRLDIHTIHQLETADSTSVTQICKLQADEIVKLKEQNKDLSHEIAELKKQLG